MKKNNSTPGSALAEKRFSVDTDKIFVTFNLPGAEDESGVAILMPGELKFDSASGVLECTRTEGKRILMQGTFYLAGAAGLEASFRNRSDQFFADLRIMADCFVLSAYLPKEEHRSARLMEQAINAY